MKFVVCKNELAEVLTIASKTLASGNTVIEALACFHITVEDDVLTVKSTNLSEGTKTTLVISSGEDGSMMVDGKLLLDIVKKLPEAIIMIEKKEETFTIDCGSAHFELKCIQGEYPSIPTTPKSGVKIDGILFKTLIERASYAADDRNMVNPIFTGVNISFSNDNIRIVTIDGYRFAIGCEKKDPDDGDTFEVLIDVSALQRMVKDIKGSQPIELIVDDHMFYLKSKNTVHNCRLIEGEPMDVEKFIDKTSPTVELQHIERQTLIQCVERSLLLVMKNSKDNMLECSIAENTFTIKSTNEIGMAHEALPVVNVKSSEGLFTFGINGRYLLDALKHYPADAINMQMTTPTAPILITSDEAEDKALILPIRIAGPAE